MAGKLFNLFWVFALLGLLAVGGGTAVLPEMQHMTVHQFGWITDKQFRDIYGLGQVAPGPNMLMVMIIGYRMAGALGVVVVTLGFFVPDCIVTFWANRLWVHFKGSPWHTAIQRGLAPVAIGLMLSGTFAIARLSLVNVVTALIALTVFVILLVRHVNPIILIFLGGLLTLLVMGTH